MQHLFHCQDQLLLKVLSVIVAPLIALQEVTRPVKKNIKTKRKFNGAGWRFFLNLSI